YGRIVGGQPGKFAGGDGRVGVPTHAQQGGRKIYLMRAAELSNHRALRPQSERCSLPPGSLSESLGGFFELAQVSKPDPQPVEGNARIARVIGAFGEVVRQAGPDRHGFAK